MRRKVPNSAPLNMGPRPRALVAVALAARMPSAAVLRMALAASLVGSAFLSGCGVTGGEESEIHPDPIRVGAVMASRRGEQQPDPKPAVSPEIQPEPQDVDGEMRSVKPPGKPTPPIIKPPIGPTPRLGGAVAPTHITPVPHTPKLAGKIAPVHGSSI